MTTKESILAKLHDAVNGTEEYFSKEEWDDECKQNEQSYYTDWYV